RTFVCQVGAGSLGVGESHTELHVYKVPETPVIEPNTGGISVHNSANSQIAKCESKNTSPPANITWHKNGEQLDLQENPTTLFDPVTREDRDSRYHCTVHYWLRGQRHALQSQKVQITVFYPTEHLKLQVVPSSALVKEGDNVKLVCESDGNPPPVFSFYKRGLDDKWQELSSLAETDSGVLTLHGVNKSSSGLYRCESLDLDDMTQLEKEVELVVNWKPRIVAISSPLYVRQDEVVNLTCKAIAFPRPSVHWSVNGTAHEYVDNQHISSNLTVRVSRDLLKAGAMCRFSNKMGDSEKHIQLLDQKTAAESQGVIIVAIIVAILVVAVLGAVIYFLHKKGKIPCGRAGKQDM
ncbi:Basal cell adhesion molecule, partial [Manacus vitellinus]